MTKVAHVFLLLFSFRIYFYFGE